jgi:hypothetical protein
LKEKKEKKRKQSHTAYSALNCPRADRTINAPSTCAERNGSETLSEKEGKKKKQKENKKALSYLDDYWLETQ